MSIKNISINMKNKKIQDKEDADAGEGDAYEITVLYEKDS